MLAAQSTLNISKRNEGNSARIFKNVIKDAIMFQQHDDDDDDHTTDLKS